MHPQCGPFCTGPCSNEKQRAPAFIIIRDCQCQLSDLLLLFYDVLTSRVCWLPNCTLWGKDERAVVHVGLGLTPNHGPLRLIQHKPAETAL